MAYFKGVLATIATLLLSMFIPMIWSTFGGITSEKATGLTAVAGGLVESVISPWFWILALPFSVSFYFSGRLDNRFCALVAFLVIRFKNH
jgi:hypothetical protein